MRKRKLLAWILTVVMLFTVLGAFPMTVSAAGAEYADDAAAAAAGYYFRTGAAGTATYYNSLVTACNEVADGGTVYVISDYTQSTGTDIIGWKSDGNNRLWDSKTITVDGQNHTATLSGNRPYNVMNSNVTFKDWNLTSSTTIGQVRPGSTLTLDNVKVTSTGNAWGGFAVYGTLILQNGSQIVATGTTAPSNNAANTAVFLQKQPQTGDILTSSDTIVPTLVLKDTAKVQSTAQNAIWFGSIPDGAAVQVQAGTVALSGKVYGMSNSVSLTFGGKAFADMTDDEKITYKKPLVFFELMADTYVNDTEAISDGKYFRVGAEGSGNYYNDLLVACNAVPESGTVEVLHDFTLSATKAIGIQNNADTGTAAWAGTKTFTVNGNNHTATYTANRTLNISNSNVTFQNLTFTQNGSGNMTLGQIRRSSTVTLDNVTINGGNNQYSVLAVYGALIMKGNSALKCTVEAVGSGNTAFRFEKADRAGDNTQADHPTLTMQDNAQITAYNAAIVDASGSTATISVTSKTAVINSSKGVVNSFGARATLPQYDSANDSDEVKAALKALYTQLGVEWGFDFVCKIGTTNYSMADALAAVQNGETITLTADLITGIVANNGKTFTIDGGGHTVAVNGSQALTVNAGTTLTVVNITLQSTTARNAVDLAGGALTLGNGAVVKSIYTNADGNSAGNGIRGTAAGSVLNVLDGATIQAGGGALVFDNQSATINISGGTITTDYYFMVFTGGGILDVTISGGTLTSTAATTANNAGAFRYYGGTHSLVITGGTINFANKTSMFGSASSLTAMKTPDWVRILGGKIEKTTAGEEATLDVDSLKSAVAGLSVTSGAAQLRIPVQASFGNSGIAFATTVDKATYDALVATYGAAAVKTGTLILPTATVPAELTYDNIVGLGTGKFLDVANSGFYNEETAETDGNYLWYGSIVNLKAKNTNRDFTGVGYIGVTTSVASIGSVTVAVCGAGTVANARTLATAAEEGNAAQNDLLNFFKTGEMPF